MDYYCVIGFPIKHSLSPRIHNRAFKKFGISARYEAVSVRPEDLGKFMRRFRARYVGANVTIPHKQKVMRFLDGVSVEARKIGAVNAIVNRGGKLIGHNTDCFGAMEALKQNGARRLEGKRAVVLGAGGAARAIIYGLKRAGAHVLVLNRTLAHAKKLAKEFRCQSGNLKDFDPAKCDILISTTSVGMWPKTSLSPLPNLLKFYSKNKLSRPFVMDIIYRPHITKLLRDAKRAGCQIITGDHMFLAQAAKSFELWTGRKSGLMKLWRDQGSNRNFGVP